MLSMESTLLYTVYCICTLPVPSFHLCNISPADMAFAMIFSEVCLQCALNWHTRPPRLSRGVVCVRPSGASLFFPISFHYHAFLWGRFGASRLIMPVVALRAFGDNPVQFIETPKLEISYCISFGTKLVAVTSRHVTPTTKALTMNASSGE